MIFHTLSAIFIFACHEQPPPPFQPAAADTLRFRLFQSRRLSFIFIFSLIFSDAAITMIFHSSPAFISAPFFIFAADG